MLDPSDNFTAHKEIIKNYLMHLNSSTPLSRWRNRLTGAFYNGQHVPNLFLDALGIKQSKHAKFIAVIDRISKIDRNAKTFLDQLNTKNLVNINLCHELFDYFISLQTTIQNKDENYYSVMSSLKHDINRFAKESGIKQRIIKVKGKKHYRYAVGTLDINRLKQKNKDQNRKMIIDKVTKVISLFNIIPEAFIVIGGYAKVTQVHRYILAPFKIFSLISAPYLAYKFAQKDLFDFCKEFYHQRLFKIKDPITGGYVDLKKHQRWTLKFLTVFCIVAGLCNAALTFTSVLTVLSSVAVPALVAGTIAGLLAGFAFSLWTAAFFRPMKTLAEAITLEPFINYYNEKIKRKESEAITKYLFRLSKELLPLIAKFALVISVLLAMYVVGTVGYFVFKDKCTHMLQSMGNYIFTQVPTFWNSISTPLSFASQVFNGPNISMAYSSIKLIFGSKKIINLMGELAEKIKQKIWPEEVENIEIKLNSIQEANTMTAMSYGFMMCLIASRSVPTTGYYYDSFIHDGVEIPGLPQKDARVTVGLTVSAFVGVTFGDPALNAMNYPRFSAAQSSLALPTPTPIPIPTPRPTLIPRPSSSLSSGR